MESVSIPKIITVTYAGKFQFKKITKNFILYFILISFQPKFKIFSKELLNCVYLKNAKNLFYFESFHPFEENFLKKIFNSANFFSNWASFNKKFSTIFHILNYFKINKVGDDVIIKSGKYKKFSGKIKKFINDWAYFSFLKKNFYCSEKNVQSNQIINFLSNNFTKKNNSYEINLKKFQIDNLSPSYKKNSEFICKEREKVKINKIFGGEKNFLNFKFYKLKIGNSFFFKLDKSIKILINFKGRFLKFLDLSGSTQIFHFYEIKNKFYEIKNQDSGCFDYIGNLIVKNDLVEILLTKHKKKQGAVKFIKNNQLIIFCPRILENNGFLVLNNNQIVNSCRKFSTNKLNILNSRTTNSLINRCILKGYENKIINQKNEKFELEISSIGKSINLKNGQTFNKFIR
jgi:hypothetical protein